MPAKKAAVEPKVEPEPGTLATIGRALDPSVGVNLVEKVGPLFLLVVYIGLYICLALGIVPNEEAAYALSGILGPVVGGLIMRMGRANQT